VVRCGGLWCLVVVTQWLCHGWVVAVLWGGRVRLSFFFVLSFFVLSFYKMT